MNPPLRHVLLIDDEPLARLEFRRLLKAYAQIEIVGEAGTLTDARALLSQSNYDLAFLDIQLRGGTGFDLLDSLRASAQVVFVTAHDRFALRAFEVNALDYLLKPVSAARLAATLRRLDSDQPRHEMVTPGMPAPMAPASHKLTLDDRVFVKTGTITRFIPVASILAITSCENYTQIFLAGGETVMVLRPLKAWQEVLPEPNFIRIHRQTIVNLAQVKRIERHEEEEIRFWFGGSFPPLQASRRQLAELRQHLRSLGLEGLLP